MSNKVKGFTLVELVVVIAVFSVIMGAALQLMQPATAIFRNSYQTESISAAAESITNYLDTSLRYAEYIKIAKTDPSDTELKNFINTRYDGKLYVSKADGTMDYVSGQIYVMKVDNKAGGKISQKSYAYKAGDTVGKENMTLTASSSYTDVLNKAIYNNYRYNISLGMATLNSGALAYDTAYYASFTSDTTLQGFSDKNFGVTVTAYEYEVKTDPTTGADIVTKNRTGTAAPYTYSPGYTFTGSISFDNIADVVDDKFYYVYSWDTTDPDHPVKKTFKDASDVEHDVILRRKKDDSLSTVSPGFVDEFSTPQERLEPDEFYIIYTYPNNQLAH